MIRIDKIQAATTGLFGGVGFRNSELTGYNIVDSTNTGSTSGLYFGDGSALVTIKNIKDSQENPSISDANFNTFLINLQKSCILDVCNKVYAGQSDFVDSLNLYPFEKSFKNTIEPSGRFVGLEIEPLSNRYIGKIPWVELSFDSVVTFNLYLRNTNKPKTNILTKSVTTVAGESTVVALDWFIADDSTYKGGKFYVGYFEDDLNGAKAYKKDYDFSEWQVNTPYFNIEPVSIIPSGTTLDLTLIQDESESFGMNIGIDIYKDFTELTLRNKNLFWKAIQLQMHEIVLNLIKYSNRSNGTERRAADNIQQVDFALYGNPELKISGVLKKLESAISDIQKAIFYVPRISKGTLG